ncbi:tetratricopeptide repeat protein [Marinomonas ostreistagni]|uniref:tetratricopeptide repeat protein n=1 Tax=Marinomonas ostreistagni TaxID=359209 RepID=UPI001950963F|nr:tetratricopeptide repeat protein [Marinomonas ostreistagni]MBM6550724.1 tetratricopeptide repeat protein [Marinomonas ostreistagni]
MENWKHVIVAGNHAFSAGQNQQALEHYQQASACAREYLGQWFDTKAAVMALVVSDLNLAETQCRLEQFSDAIDTYSTLSLDLRRFQCRFPQSNPIVGYVAQALTRVKQEFLTLTKTYAYDILDVPPQPAAAPQASGAS